MDIKKNIFYFEERGRRRVEKKYKNKKEAELSCAVRWRRIQINQNDDWYDELEKIKKIKNKKETIEYIKESKLENYASINKPKFHKINIEINEKGNRVYYLSEEYGQVLLHTQNMDQPWMEFLDNANSLKKYMKVVADYEKIFKTSLSWEEIERAGNYDHNHLLLQI